MGISDIINEIYTKRSYKTTRNKIKDKIKSLILIYKRSQQREYPVYSIHDFWDTLGA